MKTEIPGMGIFLLDTPASGFDPELLGIQHTFILDQAFSQPVKNDISLHD
ncbi:hypothetical protein HW560_21895 [Paenibacillus sp. E222]|nr:hypothetical protein [Paenibacillus sp. E222]QLG40490.1 hypothetical protein HW560_21895 [Paenibacillus sp. E222]